MEHPTWTELEALVSRWYGEGCTMQYTKSEAGVGVKVSEGSATVIFLGWEGSHDQARRSLFKNIEIQIQAYEKVR